MVSCFATGCVCAAETKLIKLGTHEQCYNINDSEVDI